MPTFKQQIQAAHPATTDIKNRRWIYVPYDRYTDRTGPLAEQPAQATGIVIVESTAKAHRRPYHKKKLALLISNMRHFALEQAARGCAVLYHFSPESHGQALTALQKKLRLPELTVMQPAERELRLDLAHAIENGLKLREVPDTTWLSTTQDFTDVFGPYKAGRSYVMDRFYRHMRQQTGILMENAKPLGSQFSHDADNRKPYKNQIPIPTPPVFPPDSITQEVIAMVERTYAHHFGALDGFDLPTTQADCDVMWTFALQHLLPAFGPYEDAMRDDHQQLFHSRTSALVNLGRLLPAHLLRDVEQALQADRIPLASAEGFIRQLLGWREFMRHIHQQTDGYRLLEVPREDPAKPPTSTPQNTSSSRPKPGFPASAFARWDGKAAYSAAAGERSPHFVRSATEITVNPDLYAGATPSALHASLPLPAVYWGVKSGLHCMDTVVEQVIREGWSHHITRLMVLSNLATLCGFSPRQLTDWFWFAYVDAYDWVVETNVLGMATYADGGLTATKPYVSGAAYINRMSNFCGHCKYDPKKSTGEDSCPFTALYWTFLERNESILSSNFRLQMPYTTLRKKAPQELVQLRARATDAIAHLQSFKLPDY